jgi:hypothetical protein
VVTPYDSTTALHLGFLRNQAYAPTGLEATLNNVVLGVENRSTASGGGPGLQGVANAPSAAGVVGFSQAYRGRGVHGKATHPLGGIGVYGMGEGGSTGVLGEGLGVGTIGVRGVNTAGGRAATFRGSGTVDAVLVDAGGTGHAVHAQAWSDTNAGIFGRNQRNGPGVIGQSGNTGDGSGLGVLGRSGSGAGVRGESTRSHGVAGINANGNDYAGMFIGHGADPNNTNAPGVYIRGTLVATGTKSAAVRTSKGTRLLYAVEAPEALFEDVGSAWLVRGKARVDLDALFAEVVQTEQYQVFVSPLSATTKGLVVVAKDAIGFSVEEIGGGFGSYAFDWRVIAKRKGLPAGHRFATIAQPPLPRLPDPQAH